MAPPDVEFKQIPAAGNFSQLRLTFAKRALQLIEWLPEPRPANRVLALAADGAMQRGGAGRSLLPEALQPDFDRIRAAFIPDAQTALTNVLAGEVHYVSDYVLSVPEGQVLEQQWGQNQGGTVLYTPATLRYTGIQLRPDYVEVPALLDVRVRHGGFRRVS